MFYLFYNILHLAHSSVPTPPPRSPPPHPLPLAITVLLHERSLELCTFNMYMLLFFFLVFRKQEGFLVLKITVNP